jgi:hypothetical protein
MVEGNARPYRYLLRVLSAREDDVELEETPSDDGWERVSERVTDDGADLVVVYRRPA